MRLRVGTWNLNRGQPVWRQSHQSAHLNNEAELWLLTEVPSHLQIGHQKPSFSASRPGEDHQYWAAIAFKWPLEPVASKHPSLAMARIKHPDGDFLVASSLFPWRTAAMSWPYGDGESFAKRCTRTLEAHSAEIAKASKGLPIVWGGDFNQALSGRERVGSDAGRGALLDAFTKLGLRAVTVEANGQHPHQRSIDHIAIPTAWASRAVKVTRPQSDTRLLSDHPSYVVSVERAAGARPGPASRPVMIRGSAGARVRTYQKV